MKDTGVSKEKWMWLAIGILIVALVYTYYQCPGR
jgi:hypothetical protein